MDSLRERPGGIEWLATRLRSQLDPLSNERENFTVKSVRECTTYQGALSNSTRRIHELGQTLGRGSQVGGYAAGGQPQE